MKRSFDQQDGKLNELTKEMRVIDQHLADLEHDAQQARLAMEADIKSNMKTHKRTENASADPVMGGDSSGKIGSPDGSNVRPCQETELVSFSTRSDTLQDCESIFSYSSTIMANSVVRQNRLYVHFGTVGRHLSHY